MLYQAIRILSGLKYHKFIFQLIGVLVAYCPRNSSSVNQGPVAYNDLRSVLKAILVAIAK